MDIGRDCDVGNISDLDMKTHCYIDAANLFYGGEKSLGWKIDYRKLLGYLRHKYKVEEAFYFGGIELEGFKYDYLKNHSVSVDEVERYVSGLIREKGHLLEDAKLIMLSRHTRRLKFYKKLKEFGYKLLLKPVKLYVDDDGTPTKKANCDVDMAFYLMRDYDKFDRVVILSGDGDFLPVLKHLKELGKEVVVLARGPRAAKEIRQFAGGNFRDFEYLKYLLKMSEKKRSKLI
ncbi:hypothetical protein A2Y83_03235 [Candidatus Falkowbacteria bacterium RBG_13_39_14]|uniref:NYN domain-containing protein n=1 Tax=Candidatus Falkowbacteria bacterium RBG_13_39_14 TaxID=1797985 RepID=A0A1F5S5Q0_9BACT|nr:MAG: hypothetical protein A2Y83_03235 [Candidatus Falkowbacteria bacterium RBG_13_39_14]